MMNNATFREPGCFGGVRLLVVEDSLINREVTREILARTGATVEETGNGRDAVTAARRTRYDAILMDVQMPEMDGYQTSRRIRETALGGEAVPIIAMTAGDRPQERRQCLDAGMNDFIAKPLQPEKLFACLEKWLPPPQVAARPAERRSEPAPPPPKTYPGIDLPAAMKRLVGNQNLLERLLGEFYRTSGDGAPILWSEAGRTAIRNGDTGPAAAYLHTLKGVAGNLSAHPLHDVCLALESALQRGETDEVDRRLLHLEAVLGEVVETARPYRGIGRLKERKSGRDADRTPQPAMDLGDLLARMKSHLAKNSLRAEAYLDRLKDRLRKTPDIRPEVAGELETLTAQVTDFAFRDAQQTLTRIAGLMGVATDRPEG